MDGGMDVERFELRIFFRCLRTVLFEVETSFPVFLSESC